MVNFPSVYWNEHYVQWNMQAPIIPQSFMWYQTNNLIYYLHHLRRCVLSNENEYLILQHEAIPATEYCRFPNDASYMCEAIGDWNIHFDTLSAYLNILTGVKALENSRFQTIDQVEIMVLEKVNVLLQCASQKKNLMTQARFEEMYSLAWREYIVLDYKSMPFIVVGVIERVDNIRRTVGRYKHRFLTSS